VESTELHQDLRWPAVRGPSGSLLRGFILLASLGVLACDGGAAPPRVTTPSQPPGAPGLLPVQAAPSLGGRWLVIEGNTLRVLEAGKPEPGGTILHTFPQGSFAASLAASPDGRMLAYTLFSPPRDLREASPGNELYVAEADGQSPRRLLASGSPQSSVADPVWAADGSALYFTYQENRFEGNRYLETISEIQRVRLDGSGRESVVAGAFSPAVSPDGESLVYLSTPRDASVAGAAAQLWVRPIAGGAARQMLQPGFAALLAPRFRPDGQGVAFAAVGGLALRWQDLPWFVRLPRWFGPRVAEAAHGVPWDLWSVNVDGSGLRRLTEVGEDSPVPAWSPDGRWIAFTGEFGLYLVDAEGGEVRRVSDRLVAPGLAWLP